MERFLTQLLISAGVLPSQAAQLARAYLVNHGVPVAPITAATILAFLGFELAGGRVQQTVGSTALIGGGSAALFPVELAPPTAQEQEQAAQAVAEASGGAVSPQAVASVQASNDLSLQETALFGSFQSSQQIGGGAVLSADTYAYFESHGLLDQVAAGNIDWWS